jgi:2-polyprenyl-6-hydroxyphenyl methylase/3-demethylubiquinone-9 3-methyltransferase
MGRINNEFYSELGSMWHGANDHPIALLRAENALRNPWIEEKLQKCSTVLDIGCGGGLLTQFLADRGHHVAGIDLSEGSLAVARKKDLVSRIQYIHGSGYALPFSENTFDAVCAMDLLEHVEDPNKIIQEASRVLKPGGLFFFHTFNRNLLSYLLVIKGVEWCLKNTPPRMHVYPLFLKPKELARLCAASYLEMQEMKGVAPVMYSKAFWRLVFRKRVDDSFRFSFTSSLKTGYSGYAQKKINIL